MHHNVFGYSTPALLKQAVLGVILKTTRVKFNSVLFILFFPLADAVFCESSEERTNEDKQIRAKQTFEEMMKYLPGRFDNDAEMWS